MLDKISGMIVEVNVLPEYETEHDQEIDIVLDSGPIVEMCVTEEVVSMLRAQKNKVATFDITDRSPCGQYVRAIEYTILPMM